MKKITPLILAFILVLLLIWVFKMDCGSIVQAELLMASSQPSFSEFLLLKIQVVFWEMKKSCLTLVFLKPLSF